MIGAPGKKARGYCPRCVVLVFVLGVGLVVGCRSTSGPSSKHFASVEIHGNTPGQISETASEVFKEHGYEIGRGGLRHIVFEKKASKMNNIAYGNWLETDVWVSIRGSIVPIADETYRLDCDAVLLRDRGGTTEERIKNGGIRKRDVQKLLDEVARRLKAGE